MKCIVKGCENNVFEKMLCQEHYDPEKQVEDARTAKRNSAGEGLVMQRQASLLMHTALLVSGKIAGKLVRGYASLFSVSPQERALILDHLATADLKKGRKTKSLEAFQNAVKLDPENPATHFKLGEFYLASAQFDKACESFNSALELDPESVEVCQALGEAYYNCEDFKSALKYLRKAVRLSPHNEKINYLIGLTHDKLGSFENAIKFLQAAVDLNPRNIAYYYSLGFVYESNGKKDQALENFKKALELEKTETS